MVASLANGLLLLSQGLPKGKQSLYQVYNEHAAIIMQIESKKGCENAQEILAVPGGQYSNTRLELSLILMLLPISRCNDDRSR